MPFPTRQVVIRVNQPDWKAKRFIMPPRLTAVEGVVYKQKWSAEANTVTASIRAEQLLWFRVLTWIQGGPLKRSAEYQIPAGTGPVTIYVQLE